MKLFSNWLGASLLASGALLAGAALSTVDAADATTAPPPPPAGAHGWHHHHHGPWHMLSKLGLSDQQKAQVKTIFTNARPQMQSLHEQMRANHEKLEQTQPNDANYASIASQVSQTHGSLSAQMMTQQADIRAQIFKVLTPAQQTQLATLEAQMRARRQAGAHGPNASDAPPAE
ncbi:MAG TPA: Spy/CpxP family protein refolding chaperone [Polyangiaceae bacterium]|jgi:Spy/CpxP family protein refolding chaperone|nr:Spy/CpxP family protein refolding chaperone [Polyangiaceae bacterium]